MDANIRPARSGGTRLSRVLAIAVLIPSVPMLLASVAGLLGFYLAPARFNAWLARLPGDDLIRTALIFAPATLVAVVVMAVLYAHDAPRREAVEATRPSVRRRGVRARSGGVWARRSLGFSVPFLVLVATAQAIDFVSPERVERVLALLPATRLLTWGFEAAPLIALAAVGLGLIFGFAPGEIGGEVGRDQRSWSTQRVARLGARLTLLPAIGLLILSAAGWVVISAAPDRISWLADRLPAETLLRLGFALGPAMFLGLILLAGLYLTVPTGGAISESARPSAQGLRSGLALGVLVGGLGFTVVMGTAVLATVVFLLASR